MIVLFFLERDLPQNMSSGRLFCLDVSRDLLKFAGWLVAQTVAAVWYKGTCPQSGEPCVLLLALRWPSVCSWTGHLTSLGLSFFTIK